jgi:NAD(P)-dependent dehydrogenase (short-subunit alcohol dehydrogenase family)
MHSDRAKCVHCLRFDEIPVAAQTMAASANPLGRNGEPHDVAGTVCFLCSRAGSWVNGAELRLDGGFSV